jgi:DNA-binding CsgD family transcriptional regulator
VSLFLEPLSDREHEVIHLIAAGLSNREITDKLSITVDTTKTHPNHIYRKLDVDSRNQAIVRGTELGLWKTIGRRSFGNFCGLCAWGSGLVVRPGPSLRIVQLDY